MGMLHLHVSCRRSAPSSLQAIVTCGPYIHTVHAAGADTATDVGIRYAQENVALMCDMLVRRVHLIQCRCCQMQIRRRACWFDGV